MVGGGILQATSTSSASTADNRFVLEQGGTEIPVTPLRYEDRTVEEFYSYGSPEGASANTPTGLERSDRSRLFLYEGPNGVSLVVIHDKPNDGDGGSVTFDFDTLPEDGSWAVPDDSWEGLSRTRASWNWVSCCTDGGAYRGGFQEGFAELTISPSFKDGIEAWELLSGDASDPAVTQLSLDQPITLKAGSNDEQLSGLAEEKLALIGDIRDTVPRKYQFREQVIDARAEQFTRHVLSESDNVGSRQRRQYGEAVERLLGAEQITHRATADANRDVIPRTSAVVVGAVANIALGKVTDLATGGAVGRAKTFLASRITRRAKSVRDAAAATDELNGHTRNQFSREVSRAESDFGEAYREALNENGDQVQSVTDRVVEHGFETVGDDSALATDLFADLPQEFRDEFERIFERLSNAIEGVFFQYFYFGGEYAEYDFSVPRVDVPDEIGFSVDIPSPLDHLPGVPDEISESVDLPTDRIQQSLDEFTGQVNDLIQFGDLAEEGLSGVGIDPVLDEGTDFVEGQAEKEALAEQDEDRRSDVVNATNDAIEATTRIADITLNIVNTLSLISFVATAVVIGLAVMTIAAFFARTIITFTATLVASNYLAAVPTMLANLGLIDLILIGINFATIGIYLNVSGWAHFGGAGTILTADLQGGDL